MIRTRIAVTLPEPQVAELRRVSKGTDIPVTRLIERAVTAYINEHYPPDPHGAPVVRTTEVSVDPETYKTYVEIEKDRAGYPIFTKDIKPWHESITAAANAHEVQAV